MGKLVPSHAGSSFALARQLEAGGGVGVLVDQKFQKGQKTTFFGRDVQTNPLLAKLARQFDCEVYPARCIRLPGNRFRLEIEPAINLPRDASGHLDVKATAQLLNDKVESWFANIPSSGSGITIAGTSSAASDLFWISPGLPTTSPVGLL